MPLSKDQLLAAKNDSLAVMIPELGGEVFVRSFTADEFDDLRKSITDKRGEINQRGMMVTFVIAGVVNDDGSPMFTPNDRQAVSKMPLRVVTRIFRAIQDHNGLGDEDTDELVGNSEATM